MLELYRRHLSTCPHLEKGQNWTKCACPVWVYGHVGTRKVRKSLGTRDWQRGLARVGKMEANSQAEDEVSLKVAVERYLEDCTTRGLSQSTLVSYGNILKALMVFCSERDVASLNDVTPATLTSFRVYRNVKPSTQRKEIESLRALFWFCVRNKWITENPASAIKPPKESAPATLPFERREVQDLLGACSVIDQNHRDTCERTRARARAMVMLMLYSGFRVSDAVKLERSRVKPDGRLMVRAMKTGAWLSIKLPKDCLDVLAALPVESTKYYFWSGVSDLDTAVKSARRTIECLGRLAKIKAHPHRFRDTFAVELLLKGTDIRTVQLLLGHKSVKTTEKHYAPFVAGFQKMLDEAVAKLDW